MPCDILIYAVYMQYNDCRTTIYAVYMYTIRAIHAIYKQYNGIVSCANGAQEVHVKTELEGATVLCTKNALVVQCGRVVQC